MNHAEDRLQLGLLMWLQKVHWDLYRSTLHYPAGGTRNKREAARLKTLGVRAGVPDLLCFAPRGEYHGLALELKTGKNKPRANQIEWLSRFADFGWMAAWANDLDTAKRIFQEYAGGGRPGAPTLGAESETKELSELEGEVATLKDQWLRAMAETENLRRG